MRNYARVSMVGCRVTFRDRVVLLSGLLLLAGVGCGSGVASSGTGGAAGGIVTGSGGSGTTASGGSSAGSGGKSGSGGGGVGTGGKSGTTGSGGAAGSVVVVGGSGCPLFTADDPWNRDVSGAAVDTNWTTRLQALVGAAKIHPDFGVGFGIPINVVPMSQPAVPVVFDDYPRESDAGPYPFPAVGVAKVEGTTDPHACDGDCHLLAVQQGTCIAYEGYACHYATDGWHCGNGAKWDLKRSSIGQRMTGWTSADAAGLSIYAGLARHEEVVAGVITHAIRMTVTCTSAAMVSPATHQAVPGGCSGNANAPPMGLRVRLKANFDISTYNATAQIFLRAFKKYGMIIADNGSNFYFQSEDSPNWNDDDLNALKAVPASAFEAVAP
jgi:hypothetical protein